MLRPVHYFSSYVGKMFTTSILFLYTSIFGKMDVYNSLKKADAHTKAHMRT